MEKSSQSIKFDDHFMCFSIAGNECGIPMSWIKKLILYKKLPSFESTPQYEDGVLYHLNEEIPLLNLRRRLGIKNRRDGSPASIIVIEIKGDDYGIVVDSISETTYFDQDMIDFTPPLLSDFNVDYIYGIAKKDMSNVILLSLDQVIAKQFKKSEKPVLKTAV